MNSLHSLQEPLVLATQNSSPGPGGHPCSCNCKFSPVGGRTPLSPGAFPQGWNQVQASTAPVVGRGVVLH